MSCKTSVIAFLGLSTLGCGSAPDDAGPIAESAERLSAGAAVSACAGSACEGKDPAQTGCSADGRTIARANMIDQLDRAVVGVVELRWSDRCQTNWSRASYVRTAPVGSDLVLSATVQRQDGDEQFASKRSLGNDRIWSPMVYAPKLCASASGFFGRRGDVPSGETRCL